MQSDCNIMMLGGKDFIDCYLGLVYNAKINIAMMIIYLKLK